MKPQPLPPNSLRENALRLLQAGQSANQVATALRLPIGKIYYWRRYYLNPLAPPEDGRRLYDEPFKQDVLKQLAAGASVAQLTQTLGVSKVTLFKWKKEWQKMQQRSDQGQGVDLSLDSAPESDIQKKGLFLAQHTVDSLFKRIHALEVEQERLRKALADGPYAGK